MERSNQPVVIDNGTGTLKAGFAGSDHPSCFFPSYVGQSRVLKLVCCEFSDLPLCSGEQGDRSIRGSWRALWKERPSSGIRRRSYEVCSRLSELHFLGCGLFPRGEQRCGVSFLDDWSRSNVVSKDRRVWTRSGTRY